MSKQNPSFESVREELSADIEAVLKKYGVTDFGMCCVRTDAEAEPSAQACVLIDGEDWPICMSRLNNVAVPLAIRHFATHPEYAQRPPVRDLSVSERRAQRTMGGE